MNFLHFHKNGSNRLCATVAYNVRFVNEKTYEVQYTYARVSPKEKSPRKDTSRKIARGRLEKGKKLYVITLTKGDKLSNAVGRQIADDLKVEVEDLNYRELNDLVAQMAFVGTPILFELNDPIV